MLTRRKKALSHPINIREIQQTPKRKARDNEPGERVRGEITVTDAQKRRVKNNMGK